MISADWRKLLYGYAMVFIGGFPWHWGSGGETTTKRDPNAKWSDTRIVAEVGADLRSQLNALSEASGLSVSELVKQALAGFLSSKGDYRAKAVQELARKLNVDIQVKPGK